MGKLAIANLQRSMEGLLTLDEEKIAEVYNVEKQIDFLNHEITNYLVKINQISLPSDDAKSFGGLFHVVNESVSIVLCFRGSRHTPVKCSRPTD